jgi:uncharacterized membrane protein
MLEYIIKVTANTFCTVLFLCPLMAVIVREDRSGGSRRLLRGIASGCLAAAMYAILKRNTGFAVREYYDLGALALSLAAGAPLVLLLRRAFSEGESPGRAALRGAFFCVLAGAAAYCLPDLLLYPFEFSVGMDTVFNTEYAFKAAGYAIGLSMMAFTGLALFGAASGMSDRLLSALASASLSAGVLREALTVIQILLGRNMIPRYKWLTGPVIWALAHINAFMYVLAAMAALAAIALYVRVRSAAPGGGNPVQVRRAKFIAVRRSRFCAFAVLGIGLSITAVTVGSTYADRGVELSPPLEWQAEGDRIVIPVERVNDGNLHRFVYKARNGSQTTDVRYIVIRKNETRFGVGLDACDVCGASGYYQRGRQVVCIQCDVVMNISTIGLPGGCNPVPLKFSVEDGEMVIMTADLEAEARRFH